MGLGLEIKHPDTQGQGRQSNQQERHKHLQSTKKHLQIITHGSSPSAVPLFFGIHRCPRLSLHFDLRYNMANPISKGLKGLVYL